MQGTTVHASFDQLSALHNVRSKAYFFQNQPKAATPLTFEVCLFILPIDPASCGTEIMGSIPVQRLARFLAGFLFATAQVVYVMVFHVSRLKWKLNELL